MQDQILLFSAGALTPQEGEMVRQHLAGGCPICAGRLAEAEAVMASLALILPVATPEETLRQRLLVRLADGRHSHSVHHVPMKPTMAHEGASSAAVPWWGQLAIPSAIAAVVAAGLTVFFAIRMQNVQPPASPVATTDLERTIGVLTAKIEQDAHDLDALRANSEGQLADWATSPDLKLLTLAGTSAQPTGACGRIFWDCKANVWHFFACGVKPAAAGKTYELWFVSTDGKTALPAGEFDPDAQGDASLVTHVPASIAANLTIAAVTDEPAGKTITAPSGSFQFQGALR
jgi:anti-sigma-K factor RskA